MKKPLAIALFCFATSASAIDVTVTLTAGQATRVAAALGELRGYKVAQADGNGAPRAATMAEVKTSVADHLRGIVMQVERPKAEKAALDAVTVAPMDPS